MAVNAGSEAGSQPDDQRGSLQTQAGSMFHHAPIDDDKRLEHGKAGERRIDEDGQDALIEQGESTSR